MNNIYPKLYSCSHCDKQEYGKPITFLKQPINERLNHDVSLMPDGWEWDINKHNFKIDSYTCGCVKYRVRNENGILINLNN